MGEAGRREEDPGPSDGGSGRWMGGGGLAGIHDRSRSGHGPPRRFPRVRSRSILVCVFFAFAVLLLRSVRPCATAVQLCTVVHIAWHGVDQESSPLILDWQDYVLSKKLNFEISNSITLYN